MRTSGERADTPADGRRDVMSTSPMGAPLFTAASVYDSLKNVRLIGSKPLPKKGEFQYEQLAAILNRLAHLHGGNRGDALEREQNREKIASAILTLTEHLPATCAVYKTELAIAEGFEEADPEYREMARRQFAAFNALVNAANEARVCGLPLADMDSLAPRMIRESDLMKHIDAMLQRLMPSIGVGERRRFIVGAIQVVSGKVITAEQARDRLRKSRSVNTGNE